MTPLQFAKAECANYQPEDGGCTGIIIHNDLTMARMPNKPPVCLLAKSGQRCAYFEECVLPTAEKMDIKGSRGFHDSGEHFDTIHLIAKRKIDYMDAVRQYRMATGMMRATKRPCPRCGQPIKPHKQLCPTCRDLAQSESNQRKNQSRVTSTPKVA